MSETVKIKRDVSALRGESKVSRIPIKIVPSDPKRKPAWIRAKAPSNPEVIRLKNYCEKTIFIPCVKKRHARI